MLLIVAGLIAGDDACRIIHMRNIGTWTSDFEHIAYTQTLHTEIGTDMLLKDMYWNIKHQ